MLYKLLYTKLRHVDPDTKFFLLAFWNCYGASTPKPCSLKQLASDLRIPAKVISKAVAQSVDAALLRARTQPDGKGRPKCIYEINQSAFSDSPEILEGALNHAHMVQHVLVGEHIRAIWAGWSDDAKIALNSVSGSLEGKRVPPVRKGQLSLANRLLLMILISRADPFGVVRGLGSKELCLLTGVDAAAFKQRLRRLVALGFIRRHIAGVASPIFSEKLKSIYLLNLNHLQLSPAQDVICTAVHQRFDDQGAGYKFVTAVWIDRELFLGRSAHSAPVTVLRLFRRAPRHAFDQLAFFIYECASGFLSRCWRGSGSGDWKKVREVDASVRAQVAGFFRESMVDPIGNAALDRNEVIDFFQRLIFDLASECVQRFSQLSTVSFVTVDYILLPEHVSNSDHCLALLILNARGGDLPVHWTVVKGYDEPVVKSVQREADIPLSMREQSGLLTP